MQCQMSTLWSMQKEYVDLGGVTNCVEGPAVEGTTEKGASNVDGTAGDGD